MSAQPFAFFAALLMLAPALRAETRFTPVSILEVAESGSLESLSLLLDAGADANAKDYSGNTVLMHAVADPAKVRLLIRHGANVKAKSPDGRTALALAAAKPGNSETVKVLLAWGAAVTVRDEGKRTVLHEAVEANDSASVKLLLESGAEANALDANGRTPLAIAALHGNREIMQYLLARGADPAQLRGPEMAIRKALH